MNNIGRRSLSIQKIIMKIEALTRKTQSSFSHVCDSGTFFQMVELFKKWHILLMGGIQATACLYFE